MANETIISIQRAGRDLGATAWATAKAKYIIAIPDSAFPITFTSLKKNGGSATGTATTVSTFDAALQWLNDTANEAWAFGGSYDGGKFVAIISDNTYDTLVATDSLAIVTETI
jgi:hypothetical protein